MKRKVLTALVLAGGLFLTACQEDTTMDELIQDTETDTTLTTGNGGSGGSGGSGSDGNGDGGVGGN